MVLNPPDDTVIARHPLAIAQAHIAAAAEGKGIVRLGAAAQLKLGGRNSDPEFAAPPMRRKHHREVASDVANSSAGTRKWVFSRGVAESALVPVDTEGRASGVRLANDGTVEGGVQLVLICGTRPCLRGRLGCTCSR